ncbi:hypothetical protein ACQR1W_31025 [Bradyrhizobium sp. HKCCYLS1011]|uniref:hypothetical protein n=1 Tax=Bradyrhizobium sp. HKCCYLS1011 TaxID=3420733 RepID=UPI003EB6AFCC
MNFERVFLTLAAAVVIAFIVAFAFAFSAAEMDKERCLAASMEWVNFGHSIRSIACVDANGRLIMPNKATTQAK